MWSDPVDGSCYPNPLKHVFDQVVGIAYRHFEKYHECLGSKNCANRAGYLGYVHIIVTTKIAESATRVLVARDSQATKAAFRWFTLYNKVNSEMVCYAGQAVTVVVGSTVTETTITEQLESSGISKWRWWWEGGWPPWILPEVMCFDKILICPLRRVLVSNYFWMCFSGDSFTDCTMGFTAIKAAFGRCLFDLFGFF